MNRYIATFHTHFSALTTFRAFQSAGITAEMAPVPRALSADCGTCLRYESETPHAELLHKDFDCVAIQTDDTAFQVMVKNDAN